MFLNFYWTIQRHILEDSILIVTGVRTSNPIWKVLSVNKTMLVMGNATYCDGEKIHVCCSSEGHNSTLYSTTNFLNL